LSHTYELLGRVAFAEGNYAEAHEHFERSLVIAETIGLAAAIAQAKGALVELEIQSGNLGKAIQLLKEALETFQRLGMKQDMRESELLLQKIARQIDQAGQTKHKSTKA